MWRLVVLFVALLLSGCFDLGGSGQSYIPPTPQPTYGPSRERMHHGKVHRHDLQTPQYVYVTDRGGKQLFVYPYGVNNPQMIRSVPIPQQPLGVAVNPVNGNVYVSCYQNVVEIYNSGAQQNVGQIVSTDISEPGGIAFDSAGNLYDVNRNGSSTITEVPPNGGTTIKVIPAVPGVSFVGGVAVNSQGAVFASINVPYQTFFLAEVYPDYQDIGITGGPGGVAVDAGDDILAGTLGVVQTYSTLYKRIRWQDFEPDNNVTLMTHNLGATAIPFVNPNDGRPPVVYVETDSASETFAIYPPTSALLGGAAVGP